MLYSGVSEEEEVERQMKKGQKKRRVMGKMRGEEKIDNEEIERRERSGYKSEREQCKTKQMTKEIGEKGKIESGEEQREYGERGV